MKWMLIYAVSSGTLVHTQAYTGAGSQSFVEFDLTSALPIDATQNIWVVFTTTQGANYPASCCANTGDPNGRWISLDGATWEDVTAYGLSNTWMIRVEYLFDAVDSIISFAKDTYRSIFSREEAKTIKSVMEAFGNDKEDYKTI